MCGEKLLSEKHDWSEYLEKYSRRFEDVRFLDVLDGRAKIVDTVIQSSCA